MTRVIAGAGGALSASTGVREVVSTLCTGVEEGLEGVERTQESGVCANRSILPPHVDVGPSLFPIHPLVSSVSRFSGVSFPKNPRPPSPPTFSTFHHFSPPSVPSFLDLASRASFSSSLIRFPSPSFPSFDGFVYPASPVLLPTLVRR